MATGRSLASVKVEPISRGNTIIFKKPGQKVRGFYLGHRKTKYEGRDVLIHTLTDDKKEKMEIWGSRVIDHLCDVKPGAVVEIKFLGKKKSSTSKRKYNAFEISVEPGGMKKGTDSAKKSGK